MGTTPPGTVKETGAGPGSVLEGVQEHNAGLRVKVHRAQPAGNGGRIVGSFELVEAGTGAYAQYLLPHEGKAFSSAHELLDEIRRHPGAGKCTHILNRNSLKVV